MRHIIIVAASVLHLGCGSCGAPASSTAPTAAPAAAPRTPVRSRTALERLAGLPDTATQVAWYGGPQAPLLMWFESFSLPPCFGGLKSRLEGYVQLSPSGLLVFQGQLVRQDTEACLEAFGQGAGLDVTLRRSGPITQISFEDDHSFMGWRENGDLLWSDERAAVEAALSGGRLNQNPAVMELIRRVNAGSTTWVVGTLDYTGGMLDVTSRGFYLSGDLASAATPGTPPVLLNFVFGAPAEADRALTNLNALVSDNRFSERLKEALRATHPTVQGAEISVSVFPLLMDNDAMAELLSLVQSTGGASP